MLLRKFLFAFLLFVAGAVIGKPLACEAFGWLIKGFFYWEKGWQFSYDDVEWKKGGAVFSHVQINEKEKFYLVSPKFILDWKEKQIIFESPKINILSIPDLQEKSDWALSMKEGAVSCRDWKEIGFSFEKMRGSHVGMLELKWQDSKAAIELLSQSGELWVNADIKNFNLQLFNEGLRGEVRGLLHLVFSGNNWKRGACQLEIEGGGYGAFCSSLDASLEWAGDAPDLTALYRNSPKEERLRLFIKNAAFDELAAVKGELSFLSGIGAKWTFEGQLDSDNSYCLWEGKSFLHSERASWIESRLGVGAMLLAVKGEEKGEEMHWEGVVDQCTPERLCLLQSWTRFLGGADCTGGLWKKGVLSGTGRLVNVGQEITDWELSCHVKEGLFTACALACETLGFSLNKDGKKGSLEIEGADFEVPLSSQHTMIGHGWSVQGLLEQGKIIQSECHGMVGDVEISLKPSGSLVQPIVAMEGKWGDFLIQSTFSSLLWNGSFFDAYASCSMRGGIFHPALEKEIAIYVPSLELREGDLFFDARWMGAAFDIARLCGTIHEGGCCALDFSRSHFLGNLLKLDISLDDQGLRQWHLYAPIEAQATALLTPFFAHAIPKELISHLSGVVDLSVDYEREKGALISLDGKNLCWKKRPIDCHVAVGGGKEKWELRRCHAGDITCSGKMWLSWEKVKIYEGFLQIKEGVRSSFEASIDRFFQAECYFSNMHVELDVLQALFEELPSPLAHIKGSLAGAGCIVYKNELEADFDCIPSGLKMNWKGNSLEWENRGSLHVAYKGGDVAIGGIDLCSIACRESDLADAYCKIDLFRYERASSLWFFQGAHIDLPSFLWTQKEPFKLSVFADFCGDKEFSKVAGCMKEGFVPFQGSTRHVENFMFCLSHEDLWAQFDYSHQGHLLHVCFDSDLEAPLKGKVSLTSDEYPLQEGELPLTLYWTQEEKGGLRIQEIEGVLAGLETSFHATEDPGILMGTARFDCKVFKEIAPADVRQLFSDLNMGQGYELKGRLCLSDRAPFFSGLLSGKQLDLFGYEWRTLLANIQFDRDFVRIENLKISDSAGIIKIDQAMAESKKNNPWTIAIPHMTVLELRPSLLKKRGEALSSSPSPLVVREIKIEQFQGLLDESVTYQAKGSLQFINSYRREHTVFDIPSDLLGRIMGLDLDILVPACGQLSFEIKEGKFFLQDLTEAYSEGKRSEFFLEKDPLPTMDFQGKLQILIACKQFVLFKFMESFMISIEGELSDPKFHLQKKNVFGVFKRFINSWLDFIFPPLCAHCSEPCRTILFCPSCWQECAPLDPAYRCKHCFVELEEENSLCSQCRREPCMIAPYAAVFSPVEQAFKLCLEEKESPEAIASFLLYQWARLDWPLPDWIIPMPKAKSLAVFLAGQLRVPYLRLLDVCAGDWRCAEDRIEEDRILLVIDQASSMSELQKATDALLEAFPKKIYVLSLVHYDFNCCS